MKNSIRLSAIAAGIVLALPAGGASAAPGDYGVLPSQSPGPWVNNPTDPANPTWGTPLGQLIQQHGFVPSDFRGAC